MPRSAAMTELSPKASAFSVPATAKSPSPAASNRSTGLRSWSMAEGHQKVRVPANTRNRQITPVADRRRRHRADHQVASDAPGITRCKRQDKNPEQIEP